MHILTISALAVALSSTSAIASKTWWTLRFAQGLECTGDQTGVTTGPGQYNPTTVCVPVPDYGYTSAVDWSIAPSSKRSFTMGLHTSSDCSGAGGIYEGSRNPVCIPLERTKAISVTRHPKKRSVTGRRTLKNLFDNDSIDEEETSESTELEQRTNTEAIANVNECYRPTFALASGVAAGTFIYMTLGTCPGLANDDDIHRGQCGLSATFSLMLTVLTGYSIRGNYMTGGQGKRSTVLPYENTTLVDGFSISYTPVDEADVSHSIPIGSEWSHYRVEHHDLEGQYANGSAIHSFHVSGKQRVSVPVREENETKLVARKAPGVAHYSWVDGKYSKFKSLPVCETRHAATKLAEQVWNHIRQNDRNEVCASLHANGIPLNHGAYALIRGTYTDQSGLC